MCSVNEEVILWIEKSPKNDYLNAVEILLKLLDNIIREPGNQKFRTIRVENATIKTKLLSLSGMKNILCCIGFELNGSEYILSANVTIAKIKKYRDFIAGRRNEIQDKIQGTSKNLVNTSKYSRKFITPTRSYHERISYPKVLLTFNEFLKMIEYNSDHVMQYEDENLLEQGRKLIPDFTIKDRAIEKMRLVQKAICSKKLDMTEPCIRDYQLYELVNWFNTDFFQWIDKMPCKICGNENTANNRSIIENGIRVEIGKCCGQETKFYRYNDIRELLVTRKGRCGEYANCFAFICRCLDFDVRVAYATFDHVWCEVYSDYQKRWIHIDPSDNVIDSPLMYQHGWKRKIDYVIAYSKDDIQDVTWRYTNNHKDTLSVRTNCTERELLQAIIRIREKRQSDTTIVSDYRKTFLNKRNALELVELIKIREPTEDEKKGRSSGGLSWKKLRGEENSINFFVFNELPKNSKQFNLRYSCCADIYETFIPGQTANILHTYKGWATTSFTAKSMFRKIEHDWKMAYLAREEETDFGEIIWKFDFSQDNYKIKEYKLNFDYKVYESGKVDIKVTNLEGSDKIEGSSGIILKVNLSGGNGDIAWQHAQLFRQKLNSNEYPFELNIKFF